MNDPDVLARARAEVDDVLGGAHAPTYEQVHRLPYLRQILDEPLRLWPTAPGFSRSPYTDTVIGGRYAIPAGTSMTVLSAMLHRDRDVWGDDAERFDPDHFAPERRAALPPHAIKPFGAGQRACIGRQFALQEAVLRVCSNHLAALAPNSTVFAFVREPTIPFRPPADPAVPMIMVGAGTGLAPFRGFLEERAAQRDAGAPIGDSLLFFGCRDPEQDYLYADELREFEKTAALRVRPVFSSRPEDGRRYVQHEMSHRADEVWELIGAGAPMPGVAGRPALRRRFGKDVWGG